MLAQKMCSRCIKVLPFTEFGKNKGRPDGITVYCKLCTRAYYNEKYATNEAFRQHTKERTRITLINSRKDPAIKASHDAASAAWRAKNPGYGRAAQARKKASKRQRTPAWSETKAIAVFYRGCPAGYEVDHVVPLIGDKYGVCGLHVLANLQYLTVADNAKKKNKWDWEKQS